MKVYFRQTTMWRLVRQLSRYFLALALLMLVLFFVTGFLSRNHRLGSTAAKHARLEKLEGPKLVLIGGSNIHYGIDSERLEKATGLPVVNMGINGSLGTHFYFDEVLPWIGQGDVVLFLGEHSHYQGTKFLGEQPLYNLVSKHPQAMQFMSWEELAFLPFFIGTSIRENLEYLPQLLKSRAQHQPTVREQTNDRGDYVGHQYLPALYQPITYDSFPAISIQPWIVPFLQAMNEQIGRQGGRLFLGFAPIDRNFVNPGLLTAIDQLIPAHFPGQHLGLSSDYALPDSLFYDTPYHLQYEFRELRTQLLIDDLREVGLSIIQEQR